MKKRKMLLSRHIAVWDVIESCDIQGSSDSSIRNVVPADLTMILKRAPVKQIYANGETAYKLYRKYCGGIGRHAGRSPSLHQPRQCRLVPGTAHAGLVGYIENLIAGGMSPGYIFKRILQLFRHTRAAGY